MSAKKNKLTRLALSAALAAAALTVAARLTMFTIGWWIDFGEEPAKSDVIVSLAGGYARSAYAAELFAQGWAPEVWISRPRRDSSLARLDRLGVHFPREEEVNRDILTKLHVPAGQIHLYGRDVNSTADEAAALRQELPPQDRRILVVTSRFHARRTRLIMRRILPDAQIRVVAVPEEGFDRRWWQSKELTQNGLFEVLKTVYFLLGGRMRR